MMKKMLAMIAIGWFAMSCDNELDINAPYENVTAVYAVLNQSDDTTWVRINRGFLGNEGIDGGNTPDSIYYENLAVSIEELDENQNVINSWILERDDSKKLDNGYWTTKGYRLYRLNEPLNQDYSYRLLIDLQQNGGEVISAVTPIVNEIKITEPNANASFTFGRNGQDIEWEQTRDAIMYQSRLTFNYVEISIFDAGDSVQRSLVYNIPVKYGTNLDGSNPEIKSIISKNDFHRFLKSNIEEDDTKIRFFRGMDLYVVAAAEDLATYIGVSQPSQGIVQDKPHYTNVINGNGIFSSKSEVSNLNYGLSRYALDSLVAGYITCDLNFGKTSQADTCTCLTPGLIKCE